MQASMHKTRGEVTATGQEIHRLVTDLYPICRSITGDGVRQSLKILSQIVPLEIHEVPSGTPVFDWTVPKEWNIRDAYIKNPQGETIVDFQNCNLHVMGYSVPVDRKTVSLSELIPHLFTDAEHPQWIPYRTSYYKEQWGFCLPHRQLVELREGNYEVSINSSLSDGSLTYGEYFLEGAIEDEILISAHLCHPSLANDNLSGVALATYIAKALREIPRRYSYRFLFIPGTIGAITWLSLNEKATERIRHGLVLACAGDAGNVTYKKSRRGTAPIDLAVEQVLKDSGDQYRIIEFSPYGYDERQFCSPGFNLPVGCFMRTPYAEFREYHTSADNLQFVKPESLADSLSKCLSIIRVLEHDRTYVNQNPRGEPQLGKRGLYEAIGGGKEHRVKELALLWVLNLSDGACSLLEIARRSGLRFELIKEAADALFHHGLLMDKTSTSEAHLD
jgi:aminopeptidase-like protein